MKYDYQNFPLALKCFETKNYLVYEREVKVLESIKDFNNKIQGLVPYYGYKRLLI